MQNIVNNILTMFYIMNTFQSISGAIVVSNYHIPPWNGDNPAVISTTPNFISDSGNRIIIGGGSIYIGGGFTTAITKYNMSGGGSSTIYNNTYSIYLEDFAYYSGNVYTTSYYYNNTGNLIIINNGTITSPNPYNAYGRRGITFDTAGNAYLSNSDNKSVGVYNRFTGLPIKSNLITGLSSAFGVPILASALDLNLSLSSCL
jgi:hypothetical protein